MLLSHQLLNWLVGASFVRPVSKPAADVRPFRPNPLFSRISITLVLNSDCLYDVYGIFKVVRMPDTTPLAIPFNAA